FAIGPNGAPPVQVDTGKIALGFDKLEVQVLSPAAGSVSVVGPTSNFTLATTICPGTTITDTSTDGTASSGQVTASFTYVAGSGCKALTQFTVSANDPSSSSLKSIEFDSQPLAGAHITGTFDWGYFPYCRADATVQPGVPACPTTLVNFGSGF